MVRILCSSRFKGNKHQSSAQDIANIQLRMICSAQILTRISRMCNHDFTRFERSSLLWRQVAQSSRPVDRNQQMTTRLENAD